MFNGVALEQPESKPQRSEVTRVSIPAYLLPQELQEMHQRICDVRSTLRELERDFNGMLRGYFRERD